MDTHLFLQVLGYVASALVAASLMMKSLLRLRVINLVGASLMATYGLLIHAWPVAVLNGTIVLVDLYYLNQMWRQRDYFKLLAIGHDSEYLRGFVKFHRDEIAAFVPGYAFEPDPNHHHLLVLRNMVPAGLVILEPEGATGTARVLLDFVIPGYRDFGVGRFLFDENAAWFRERDIRRLVSDPGVPRHAGYLERMGFRREGDVYTRELGRTSSGR
ncbi:MAG: GNAT family N-acetyltransferase [Candidatus Eisenbacteria bacterium]|uniref:GNAT family N-acetyltransferase n=1 Tax=Eiseniibacteriota bacterium TaxID=2212470 RepID=A0A933WBH7_UNCEI|nr:GNAT family N-acetyltransferase [Candidatus Eisenbacteria bacterium]